MLEAPRYSSQRSHNRKSAHGCLEREQRGCSMHHDLHDMPKIRDSCSFLYAERCRIEREDAAITISDRQGTTQVPVAALSALLLGPGTSITHAAMRALAENGCTVSWCGQQGVRCYAAATGETHSARRLLQQAALLANPVRRLEVVWRMYEQRFGYRLDRALTLPQIRGMEGARMREMYATAAARYGVAWRGRHYVHGDWQATDAPNRALSAANACLYGLCHAAVVSVGYSPGLGFIHTGHQLSFVFDVADLYKAEISIPVAFRMAGENPGPGLGSRVRRACRDAFQERQLLKRIVPEIDALMGLGSESPSSDGPLPSDLWESLLRSSSVEGTP